MKRVTLLTIPIVFALFIVVVAFSVRSRPSAIDYRLARGRALLDTENYLDALETLRGIAVNATKRPEAHSYLGAAYLRLHLYKAAIQEFEEAMKLHPREADPWVGLAATYIQLGEASKAIEEAKRATEVQKRSADAWIALARAYWQDRNFVEAEKAGLKAREFDPQNTGISELLLHVYFDQNAADKFQSELDRDLKPAPAVQDLAVRFALRQGRFAQAYDLKARYTQSELDRTIIETELALKREPDRNDLYAQLIRNLVRTGRFERVVELAPKYRGAIPLDIDIAKAYWMTGRKDEAIQSYRRASSGLIHKLPAEIALAAISGDIAHWREAFRAERPEQDYFILAQLEDVLPKATPIVTAFIYRYAGIFDPYFYNKSAESALQVLDKEPQNFDALMTIGTAYQRLGRNDDAIRYLERAHEAFPKNAEPLSRLANLTLGSGEKNPQKIVDLMQRAVSIEPRNAGYLYNLGWVYDQTGDTSKAIELYQRAIESSPLSFESMNNLALLYAAMGQPERALPLLQQAIRTDPESEAAYFNIANYYVRRHDWRQALQNYDRILQINASNAAAAVEKGRIYLELGRAEDAIQNLNDALELDAHSSDAYLLLSSAYEKTGHVKEAAAAAEEAQRIRPDSEEARAILDRVNLRLGKDLGK